MLNRKILSALLLLFLLAHLPLLWTPTLAFQAASVLLFTGLLPGLLWVELLVGRSQARPTWAEYLLYTVGAGYANQVVVMLFLSYLPGGVTQTQTLLAFDALFGVLWALLFALSAKRLAPTEQDAATPLAARPISLAKGWVIVGAVVLLLVGSYFRFASLGYSEFQGDEARATLRAAAVIQGYEDVLFIHKKGPTEILLPTVIYSLTGHLNETTARLPFAVANLIALFAIWLLGWRLLGPLAGWVAAFLLAFDGYLIGFSQIVQYQSIVILVSALAVMIAYRLWCRPVALTRYLLLAAILLATGLLSHYEAAQAAVPIVILLVALFWKRPEVRGKLLLACVPATVVGGALLASFYVPFLRHPHFAATYVYLVDRRVGDAFPYNNLADFLLRSMVYNSSYYVLLMIGLVVVAALVAYRDRLKQPWRTLLIALTLLVLALTFWRVDWLAFGATDLIVLPFAFLLVVLWLLPRLALEERALWLWFGAPLLVAFFFTVKPRTHIYIFFTAWALLAGMVVAQGWQQWRTRLGARTAVGLGTVATVAATVVFGSYAYWYFVHTQTEILRTWDQYHPAGYWTPYTEPDKKAIFGFPLANGWKVVGALYANGTLQGDYETSEKEAWVPAWYTRGQRRCERSAQWFFQIENLEPFDEGDRLAMEHFLRQGFAKWGKVEINGADRMIIYKRTGVHNDFPTQTPNDNLTVFPLDDYAPTFDQLAQAQFPLTYPEVEAPIAHPMHVNLNNLIWLEGYRLDYPQPLRPGDMLHLTLYWRGQQPIPASYKVFNQSYYGNGTMIAQQDGYPVCETRETWRWDPGELITDEYEIPVQEDAPDGLYPLYTGMYIEETFDRLPILDEAGNVTDNQIHLTDIRVGVE
ncbi:MAG: glycosyltransferase family 39 protein [Caldilineaceae bacterium]